MCLAATPPLHTLKSMLALPFRGNWNVMAMDAMKVYPSRAPEERKKPGKCWKLKIMV